MNVLLMRVLGAGHGNQCNWADALNRSLESLLLCLVWLIEDSKMYEFALKSERNGFERSDISCMRRLEVYGTNIIFENHSQSSDERFRLHNLFRLFHFSFFTFSIQSSREENFSSDPIISPEN